LMLCFADQTDQINEKNQIGQTDQTYECDF
jgi:hypothetical protein